MSQPKWITPSGDLGTIPELEYYEFPLDAYDPTGGGLTFSLVSGKLPLGLQIISTGKIQGVPVSELQGDINVQYKFTIRVKNTDKQVADRTFSVTITNVAIPAIVPKDIDLGTYLDGTYIDTQLIAVEPTPSASLTWKLVNGTLPVGLSLSKSGRLTGYLYAIPAIGPAADPGWDDTAWDLNVPQLSLPWDFVTDLVSHAYKFTIQVYDGVNYDESTYQVVVTPRQDLVISNTHDVTADRTTLRVGYDFAANIYSTTEFTASETNRHQPILLTTQDDLIPVKQNSYFAFQFKALDLDEDVLKFAIATSTESSFDETNYDTTKFDQSDLSVPGLQLIRKTNYIAAGSSGTTFKVDDTTGVYVGLLVVMDSELGGNRTVIEVVDSNTLILSLPPEGTPVDGSEVRIINESDLHIDENTGWLTGRLPDQTINEVIYEFELLVYKRDYTEYETRNVFYLTVRGDLNDTINWITPSILGTIENGTISEFFVEAESTTGKRLFYSLTTNSKKELPQGLQLNSNGLIYGRVSFEIFNLDTGATTIDKNNTSFDNIYEFTITASDIDHWVLASKTFKIQVIPRNSIPYENLYLKALPSRLQREKFLNIVNNHNIFKPELIYRNSDPNFGVARDIKFLFVHGLEANLLSMYAESVINNHFTKRIMLGDIKTAVVLDSNFEIQYEVVYIDVIDTASNSTKGSASNVIDLTETINPYYDLLGNEYTVAYPNGFNNMKDAVLSIINYSNKGALPRWMSSNQKNDTNLVIPPLGLTHGVVLAYTLPGSAKKIAYQLENLLINDRINLNEFDFTVDRYQLDNIYSKNYNIVTKKYFKSSETTFDKLITTENIFNSKGSISYALSVPYDTIHQHSVDEIKDNGGLDGILNFSDGDLVVFAKQEFNIPMSGDFGGQVNYNYGWSNNLVVWDVDAWAYNINTLDSDTIDPNFDLTPGQPWDQVGYVNGYLEYTNNSAINQRIGIWRVNISANNFVTLTFVQEMNLFDKVDVLYGDTYGGTSIYYDPTIKPYQEFPSYSIIPRELTFNPTIFDGNGTKFLSYRDLPIAPEDGDKYIKFAKLGVFT